MNAKRQTELELLAFEVDDFQQQILPKIKAILIEEEKVNGNMDKMPVNYLYGTSAIEHQKEKSDIYIDGLSEAINLIDKYLTEVYRILIGAYV